MKFPCCGGVCAQLQEKRIAAAIVCVTVECRTYQQPDSAVTVVRLAGWLRESSWESFGQGARRVRVWEGHGVRMVGSKADLSTPILFGGHGQAAGAGALSQCIPLH